MFFNFLIFANYDNQRALLYFKNIFKRSSLFCEVSLISS